MELSVGNSSINKQTKFILDMKRLLVGCSFNTKSHINGNKVYVVCIVKTLDGLRFELELHDEEVYFRDSKFKWKKLNYDSANDYILKYISSKRGCNKSKIKFMR